MVWKPVMHCLADSGCVRAGASTAAQSAEKNALLVKMGLLHLGSASCSDVCWALVRAGRSWWC